MIYKLKKLNEVEKDILDAAKWIDRDSPAAADRFLVAVQETISSLRMMPGRGSLKHFQNIKLSNIRSLGVTGFPKYLVLYQVQHRLVVIIAVMHGARDYEMILDARLP